MFFFALGMAKKVLLENPLPGKWPIWPSRRHSTRRMPVWAFRLRVQIYFDFSGYSDIAIGWAQLLRASFKELQRAVQIGQHSGLLAALAHLAIDWLRDYLYIPLGGSRKGEARTCFNLMLPCFSADSGMARLDFPGMGRHSRFLALPGASSR